MMWNVQQVRALTSTSAAGPEAPPAPLFGPGVLPAPLCLFAHFFCFGMPNQTGLPGISAVGPGVLPAPLFGPEVLPAPPPVYCSGLGGPWLGQTGSSAVAHTHTSKSISCHSKSRPGQIGLPAAVLEDWMRSNSQSSHLCTSTTKGSLRNAAVQ
eukprot:1157709-Pelagomonas_calceolata.AAC.2